MDATAVPYICLGLTTVSLHGEGPLFPSLPLAGHSPGALGAQHVGALGAGSRETHFSCLFCKCNNASCQLQRASRQLCVFASQLRVMDAPHLFSQLLWAGCIVCQP